MTPAANQDAGNRYLTVMPIAKITLDRDMQPRADMDDDCTREYGTLYKHHVPMPAVVVFFDGVKYWLADGWHRVLGCKQFEIKVIEAEVRKGTRRDAILYAVGANQRHGLRRSPEDRARAVRILFADKEWGKWSDREIGRRCGVGHPFVAKERALWRDEQRIRNRIPDAPKNPVKCQRNGTVYTIFEPKHPGSAEAPSAFAEESTKPVQGVTYEVREFVRDPVQKAWAKLLKEATSLGHREEALPLLEQLWKLVTRTRKKRKR